MRLTKQCRSCRDFKPTEDFAKNVARRSGLQSWCRQCHSEYRADKELVNKYSPESRASYLIKSMKERTKLKNYSEPVEWTKKELFDIITKERCPKTNLRFDFKKVEQKVNPFIPTPDRIDSSKGYTKENTQLVCHYYNNLKSDYIEEDLEFLIESLAKCFYKKELAQWYEDVYGNTEDL